MCQHWCWQHLAGHLNWMLNVLPWGHLALTEMYQKMSGKLWSHCMIPINAGMITDLSWLKSIIPSAIRVHFVSSGLWVDHKADMMMWTDASLHAALAFIYSNKGFLYPINPPPAGIKIDIFFPELLTIVLEIHYAGSLVQPPHCLLIWTDSLDSLWCWILSTPLSLYTMHYCLLLQASSFELGWIYMSALSKVNLTCALTCYLIYW